MIYAIDIDSWVRQMLPPLLIKISNWVDVTMSPVKILYQAFIDYRKKLTKDLQINGQTIVLENYLNDLFDATNRGITIVTSFDLIEPIYFPQPGSEFLVNPIWIGQPTEDFLYIGQPEEYGINYDFVVTVPTGTLTAAQETMLKFIVYKYKLASRTPYFTYDNNTPF